MKSADEMTCVRVSTWALGGLGAAPHGEVGLPEWCRRRVVFIAYFRKMNPGHRGVTMVIEMQMMVHPKNSKKLPACQIASPFLNVSHSPVMMDVLERGPQKPEAAHDNKIMEKRDVKKNDE
jgi:hypothetical protein